MQRILIFALSMWLFAAPALAGARNVNLFIWAEYLPDAVLEAFTRETGITTTVSTYDSNEALYAKVTLMQGKGYDLIVPSADFVARMRKEGLLHALDKAKLPSFSALDATFTDQRYDPGNAYSVPYLWGSTAIAVNVAAVPGPVVSFKDLAKPKFAGKLILPNDMRMVLGVGLKMRGYSLNATDPKQIKSAYLAVAPIVKNTKIFDSDSPKDALLANQVAAGVVWNGEVCAANRKNPDIKYIYPREGFALWIDSLCIPKSAPNLAEAYALINYLLRPEVSATISSELGYATPYAAARELLGPEIQKNPMVYPPTQDFARGEKVIDVGAAIATYEKYWMLLRAKK